MDNKSLLVKNESLHFSLDIGLKYINSNATKFYCMLVTIPNFNLFEKNQTTLKSNTGEQKMNEFGKILLQNYSFKFGVERKIFAEYTFSFSYLLWQGAHIGFVYNFS